MTAQASGARRSSTFLTVSCDRHRFPVFRSTQCLPVFRLTQSFFSSAVMGDHGTLYVADSVIPIYRSLLSLATVITPNQFEAEFVQRSS